MKKAKFKKHPAKMTSDELAESVFHPKVLKAARQHLHGLTEAMERTEKNVSRSKRLLGRPKPPRSSK